MKIKSSIHIFFICAVLVSCSNVTKNNTEKEKIEVSVITDYKGATSVEIEHLISEPVERAVSSIKGVIKVSSSSSKDVSVVTVEFSKIDIFLARQLVLKNIQEITSLPEDVHPEIANVKSSHFCFKIKVYGDDLELMSKKTTDIVNELYKVDGIKNIETKGNELQEFMAIEFDRKKLAVLGISSHDVTEAINNASENKDGNSGILIRIKPEIKKMEEYSNIVIAEKNNQPIYLKDVAVLKMENKIKEIVRDDSKRVMNVFVGLVDEANLKKIQIKIESILTGIIGNSNPAITYKLAELH